MTKKTKKVEIKKVETMEEFLARGGKIQKIEYKTPEAKGDLVRSSAGGTGLPTIMSLSDGAHFFGETRKKKPTKEDFDKKVNKSNLPQDVIDSLTKSIKDKA